MNVKLQGDDGFVRTAYLRQLGPVGLSVLLVQLSSIINNIIVGRLVGTEGLAVMSAVNPVYFTFSTLGALLATGGSTVAARLLGENKGESVDRVFTLSVVSLAITGAVITFLGLIFKDQLIGILGVPRESRELARQYLTAYLPGAIGVMGIYVPFNNLKLVGKQNQSVMLFLVMALVNAGLNWLLTGVMKMGMTGVALATDAGAWTAFLLGMALLCGKGGSFKLMKPAGVRDSLGRIFRFGSPSATNNLCNTLFALTMNHIILGRLGGMGLAAFSLIMTLRSFSMSINNGVSMTEAPYAAVFSGERDSASLKQLLKTALVAGAALMAVFAGIVALFPARICALFGVVDPEKLALAVPAIRAFALSLPITVINYALISFYASQGKTLLSNAMTVLRAFALVTPLALALSRVGNGDKLWYAFLLAEAGDLIIAWIVSGLYSRRHPHTTRFALIDTSYEDDGRFIAFSVAPSDEAASVSSAKITEFCEANELPPRTTMAISLALEEMLVIFNKHALEIQKESPQDLHGSTVRLLIYRRDTVILRMRCFGKPFDPIKTAKAEDVEQEYIGVRMIQKLARDVVYTHTLGINTLTITI